MKHPLLRCLALVLSLLLLLAPARAQVLRGTFAASASHSLSIHADGTLWAAGDNQYGQLGIPLGTSRSSAWVQVGTAANWVMVAAGRDFTLALRTDGSLWAWGNNRYGQLGSATGTGVDRPNPTPTRVGTDLYTQVAASDSHSLALRADGSLWAWGYNSYGELGYATNAGMEAPNTTPAQVGTGVYTQVATGTNHSLALRADGTLYAWGRNYNGQLGYGTNAGTNTPTSTPLPVGTARYSQLAAGGAHSLALRADGTLWAWGTNFYGQLGNPDRSATLTPTQVGTALYTQVAAGGDHSLGVRADGSLYAWGLNYSGELGNDVNLGAFVANTTPALVGTGRYVQVAAGYYHSLGLRADGSLWAWGSTGYGKLGTTAGNSDGSLSTPTATGTALPTRSTAASNNFGLAVRADGTLWAWGDNSLGQFGDGTTTSSLLPKQVGTDRDWVQVTAGQFFGMGLKANGTLWAWGYNSRGQLGTTNLGIYVANPTPMRVGTDLYTRVAAGTLHCLGLRADGTLWAWGDNYNGQLGNSTNSGTSASNPTPAQVGTGLYTQAVAGGTHSLGLRADGTLWAWGDNSYGQLGVNNRLVTNPVPRQVGTDLYQQAAAGNGYTLGLRATGSLYAWGSNQGGQLGNTTNAGTAASNPTPTRVGTDLYTQVAVGSSHSLGLRADGSLWTWGANYESELGQSATGGYNPNPTQEATLSTGWASLAPGPASFSSLVRTASGLTFASAGLNSSGQLGDGTTTDATRFDRLRPLGTAQPLPVLAAAPTGPGLALYPNPAPGHATTLRGATPGAPVLVLDALGRPVLATTADAAGTARLRLPAALAPGVYLVRTGRQALRLSVE